MNKLEKIEEILREYENGCNADVTAEGIINGIKNVLDDNKSYTPYEAKKLRKENNSLLDMKGKKHIPFKALVEAVEELPFNKTISIAEDAGEEEGWWNLTKLDIGDGKTLLCNYWGGGYPYSFSIDEMGDTETVEYALKEFFRFAFNMSEDNGLLDEGTEVCVEFESEGTQQEEQPKSKDWYINEIIKYFLYHESGEIAAKSEFEDLYGKPIVETEGCSDEEYQELCENDAILTDVIALDKTYMWQHLTECSDEDFVMKIYNKYCVKEEKEGDES